MKSSMELLRDLNILLIDKLQSGIDTTDALELVNKLALIEHAREQMGEEVYLVIAFGYWTDQIDPQHYMKILGWTDDINIANNHIRDLPKGFWTTRKPVKRLKE